MSDDEAALIALANDWMAAWQRDDRARIEEILAPEFTLISSRTDRIVERAEWIALLDQVRNDWFAYEDVRVDVFGDAAVVRSRMSQRATVGDQPWDATFMLTDVWIRRDGRWQVVARHSSLPPTKAFTD
jgi:ketosteroid isomerase-like protein